MKRGIILAISLLFFIDSFGQQPAISGSEKWDIVKCVDFALKNNISVRQADLQSRFSALTYGQSKAAKLPSLNFSASSGYQFGRSENPTTGVLEDNNFFNTGMQLQSQVSLFNWFSQKNRIEANRLTWEADKEQKKKAENDIALNVATAYLQVLLAKEQVNIAKVQVATTASQLENTRKRVDAGALPELNAAELEAQLARDSSSLVTAETSVQQFILQMKALLNLDAAAPFDVVEPAVNIIPIEPLADLQPDAVYALAMKSMPQQKVNELRIQSAKKSVASAKGEMYPTISAFGNLFTNAISFKKVPIYNQVINGYTQPGVRVDVGGTYYLVEVPTIVNGTTVIDYYKPGSFTKQFNNNFGQSIGIGISVPIFNGKLARTSWERSKITVQQMELDKEQSDMQLKQDIYLAYTNATAALQKFNADKKGVETATKAFNYARKRYDLNLLSTYELINSQNNFLQATLQALYSQYDYIFKMKLLEFYKGQGLKL